DQLLRGGALRNGAGGDDATSPRQADHGVADARHERRRAPPLADDSDPDGPDMKVGFAGPFSVRLADRVRRHLNVECEMILAEESGVVGLLPDRKSTRLNPSHEGIP